MACRHHDLIPTKARGVQHVVDRHVYERTFQRPIRPSEGPMTTTARAVRQAPAASPAPYNPTGSPVVLTAPLGLTVCVCMKGGR